MLYKALIDALTFSPDASVSYSAASTKTAVIRQEPRRLEAIQLAITWTTGSSTANNGDALAGLVKEIRLRVNDVLGSRNAIQIRGPSLLSFVRQCGINIGRKTSASYTTAALADTTAYTCVFYIPCRDPRVQEPFANALALPLSSEFMREDALLEVDFYPLATVFSAGTTTVNPTIKAQAIYREVPPSVPYIPWELRSEWFVPGGTGKQIYQFGSTGFLTGVLIQPYSATYANGVTHVTSLSSGGQLLVEYGRQIVRRLDEALTQELNDGSMVAPAWDTASAARCFTGEMFLDFLTDHPESDAFAPNSCYNLAPEALSGDKMKLTFNDYANSAYYTAIAYHKFLATQAEISAALGKGI